jgi:hypothetical protein
MRSLIVYIVLFMTVSFLPVAADSAAINRDFSYYQVILDKKPFGELTPPENVQPQAALSETIGKELELKAIVGDDAGLRVCLLDKKTNKNFFLGVGESRDNLQLVSVNYEKDEAVLKKGDETATIKFKSVKDKNKPGETPQIQPQMAAAPMQMAAPPAFTNIAALQPGRKPFFGDLQKRRVNPFQVMATNVLPFQAKPLDSFFKVSTGNFPHAQSPFGPFQAVGQGAKTNVFQQFMRPPANAVNPFMPIAATNANLPPADQLFQNPVAPVVVQQPVVIQQPAESEAYDEEAGQ